MSTIVTNILPSNELNNNSASSLELRDDIPGTSLFAMHAINTTVENEPLPPGMTRADVHVEVKVSLESQADKANPHRVELAKTVQENVREGLSKWYTATSSESAKLLLKVYVVLASEGNAVNGMTFGYIGAPVEECLEWFLQSAPDGSVTYKAGRAGSKEGAMFGRDELVTGRLPKKLVHEIVAKIGIANQSASLKHQA
jgi:hypothetical protein